MKRRVVVTGVGVISPIGIGKVAYWKGLKEGLSGIKRITQFDVSNFPVQFAGEVTDFDPSKFLTAKQVRRLDRFSQFGLAAARLAVAESRLELERENRDRIGISLGTAIGTFGYGEKQVGAYLKDGVEAIHPLFGSFVVPSSCATEITIDFKIFGPAYTNVNACAASTSAIGMAFHLIRDGQVDVMIAGGSEAPISPVILSSLASSQILSKATEDPEMSYRPFSKDRSGIIVGEGAGIVILEELEHAMRRRAPIIAEIGGFGASCDGFHVLFQPQQGERAVGAVRQALNDAQMNPNEIGYINAHGSGTVMNDKTETAIIKKVFGDYAYRIPISATKSMVGHTMGACGALELVACILMMEYKFLHPTINYTFPDPECDLDYIPNKGYQREVDAMLKLSFGFGGYNAACILKRYCN
jgi:3-oxoacyl-[acyl-carrier-protein] synthase II